MGEGGSLEYTDSRPVMGGTARLEQWSEGRSGQGENRWNIQRQLWEGSGGNTTAATVQRLDFVDCFEVPFIHCRLWVCLVACLGLVHIVSPPHDDGFGGCVPSQEWLCGVADGLPRL